MQVVILGSSGLLGSAFAKSLDSDPSAKVLRLRHDDDVLASTASLVRCLDPAASPVVFNCAALADAEKAETSPEADFAANVLLPTRVAEACAATGSYLVQMSSTGCYGDWKSEPYVEADRLAPTTVHHGHKAKGEDAVRRSGAAHLIARTGWLYGITTHHAKNFVWKRLLEARAHSVLTSDTAQHGCPTDAAEVARQLLVLVAARQEGTYNVVAEGTASRFDYVREIVRLSGLPCDVRPGPAYRRLAAVSWNEMAINRALTQVGRNQMRDWHLPLAEAVATLMAENPV